MDNFVLELLKNNVYVDFSLMVCSQHFATDFNLNGLEASRIVTGESERDPLAELYQMEQIESTPEEKDALVLVTRLLENVEEFYELREQLFHAMNEDASLEPKVTNLFDVLIQGLEVEQNYMKVELLR